MNALQKAYCDGAAMAYRDVAQFVRGMIARSPPELKAAITALEPLAEVCENKAGTVHHAAEYGYQQHFP